MPTVETIASLKKKENDDDSSDEEMPEVVDIPDEPSPSAGGRDQEEALQEPISAAKRAKTTDFTGPGSEAARFFAA